MSQVFTYCSLRQCELFAAVSGNLSPTQLDNALDQQQGPRRSWHIQHVAGGTGFRNSTKLAGSSAWPSNQDGLARKLCIQGIGDGFRDSSFQPPEVERSACKNRRWAGQRQTARPV